MKVKVCGITEAEDALLCAEEGADAIGFVFAPESKRYLEPAKAALINSLISPLVMKIGVFVNREYEEVNRIAAEAGLNAVQLHGCESPGYIKKIKLPVIKSFRIKPGFDFGVISRYSGCGILLDSFSHGQLGGTGKTFDKNLIPDDLRSSVIIAGGISTENVIEIAEKIKPAGIDLSSSLEHRPGRKDPAKVKEFFKIIRRLKC